MTDIVTVAEGTERLLTLERVAIKHFHNSREAFDKAILALWQISQEKLWEYAVDVDGAMLRDYRGGGSFETYLGWFCTNNGVSRSSVQQHLKTPRTWQKLGRPMEELERIGIRRAGPITSLVKYDARSDEVEIPSQEVLDSLPPISISYIEDDKEEFEFIARANLLIDEVLIHPAEPLMNRDVRKAFTIDVDTEKSEVNFFENDEHDIWFTCETGDDFTDGVLFSAEEMVALPEKVREKVMKRLRVIPYD